MFFSYLLAYFEALLFLLLVVALLIKTQSTWAPEAQALF